MQDLKDVYMTPLPVSPYVKPMRMYYTQNGNSKNWDLLEVHDSVAVIIYNLSTRSLILVKQFRPGKYLILILYLIDFTITFVFFSCILQCCIEE